jgi:hypothetical protein
MLAAEPTVLLELKTLGSVLLVLHGVVVSLLAFAASQYYLNSHYGTSYTILPPCIDYRRVTAAL